MMNDFTKEELEYMLRVFVNLVRNPDDHKNIEIVKKLKLSVDNYCEHEWRISGMDAIYCPKCQQHVEYEV